MRRSAKQRVAAIALVAAALGLAACGDDSDDDGAGATTPTTASTGTAAPTTTSAADDGYGGGGTGTTMASGAATVSVADNPEFGELLVGPNGHTLYLFEEDDGTTSACTGNCATNWPALTSEGDPEAGDGVDQSKLETADGQLPNQVVYNGHLLYYFHSDSAPGDVKGAGLPEWYPVNPDGEAIEDE